MNGFNSVKSPTNPLTPESDTYDVIDFTLSNTRQFYSSNGGHPRAFEVFVD